MAEASKPAAPPSLKHWLWRSYLRAALVPLLLIEIGFLLIYWITTNVVYDRSAQVVTDISTASLTDTARREADVIARRLQAVTALTQVYADEAGRALATPAEVSADEQARHAISPDGVFHSTRDTGGSAVFYSGVVPVGAAERDKVWRTVRLDPLMKSIVEADPLITQVYVNTWDSLNRIYPYFDVLATYAPGMSIPDYNFYYEADYAHNPARQVVWTDAYLDPAGSGWMVSAIAPVYSPDRLEAVVGIDVTVANIIAGVLDIELQDDGYAILVSRDGTILALPPAGEADFGLGELTSVDYESAVLQDTFKPEAFNIFRRAELGVLVDALQSAPMGHRSVDLSVPLIAAWSTVAGPEWKLIVLTSEAAVLSEATDLRGQLAFVSQVMLAILVMFYLGFFVVLWSRSASMSRRVAQPLAEIEANMARITEGGRLPASHAYEVAEVQALGDHLVKMGEKLDTANKAKSNFLSAMSHELRTPLNAVIGLADVLGEREANPERNKMIRAISAAGWQLLQLVEGVIDLSRIEKAEVTPNLAAVDAVQVARAAALGVRTAAKDRAIVVTVEAPDSPLPMIKADAEILRRILQQILSNGVKYNRDGGEVRVRFHASTGTGTGTDTGTGTGAGTVAIAVTDNGQGIPLDRQSRLFTPFDRLGHENSTIAGAGIGLTVAQRLGALMGCKITVDSKPGEGATFTVHVPEA